MRFIHTFLTLSFYIATHASRKTKNAEDIGGHTRGVLRILRKDPLYFFLGRGIQNGRGREIGSAESRIPSIGDRQGNSDQVTLPLWSGINGRSLRQPQRRHPHVR